MQKVKEKIVSEYDKLVLSLHVGKEFDYSHIIDMINFIDISEHTNNQEAISNYFINK